MVIGPAPTETEFGREVAVDDPPPPPWVAAMIPTVTAAPAAMPMIFHLSEFFLAEVSRVASAASLTFL